VDAEFGYGIIYDKDIKIAIAKPDSSKPACQKIITANFFLRVAKWVAGMDNTIAVKSMISLGSQL